MRRAVGVGLRAAGLGAFAALSAALLCGVLSGCGGSSSGATSSTTTTTTTTTPTPASEPNSCSTTETTSPAQTAATPSYPITGLGGRVMAGELPVVGAVVQIYAAGMTGNGSAATPLLSQPVVVVNGAFSAPALTCPYSNSVLYAVASGGTVGGVANPQLVLASVLGTCGGVTNGAVFTINEATTVATAYAMAQFWVAGGTAGGVGEKLGATATNSSGIGLAAATAANLVNLTTGAVPGTYFPATGTAPVAKINTLANALHACAVGLAGACGQLDAAATTTAGAAANTLDAAIDIAKQPGSNVAAIYSLSAEASAYTPVLSAAPADWTLAVSYGGGGMSEPTAVSIDSTGKIWVANYNSVASLFSNTGAPVFASGLGGDNLDESYGGAVDVNDQMWITDEESSGSLNGGMGAVTVLNGAGASPATYTSGGIDYPYAMAFDTSGVAWVVDYGMSHLTLLSSTGTPLSGASGYLSSQFNFPVAVATDALCNGYVANQSSDTITKVIADGSSFTSYVVGDGPSGLAVDAADDVWTANYYGNSVGLLSATGTVLSGSGFTGGGIDAPQGIAVDGGGDVWVGNYVGKSLTELAGAAASAPGEVLSPSAGWGADAGLDGVFGVAVDASGNVWVSNLGSNTLTEFVGLAVPVKTPLLGPVRTP